MNSARHTLFLTMGQWNCETTKNPIFPLSHFLVVFFDSGTVGLWDDAADK